MDPAIDRSFGGLFHDYSDFPFCGGQLGDSIPNCLAYSAFNRCQPNFIASPPTMRPMGFPLRRRSSTSKHMCHPAAPMAMKRRPMLVHSVRRVPPPRGFKFPAHLVVTPVVLKRLWCVGSPHFCFGNVRRGRCNRGELHRGSNRSQAPIGFKGSPLAQMRRVGKRLPDFFRRVAQFSDENQRPLFSVLLTCAMLAGPGEYCSRSVTSFSLS